MSSQHLQHWGNSVSRVRMELPRCGAGRVQAFLRKGSRYVGTGGCHMKCAKA